MPVHAFSRSFILRAMLAAATLTALPHTAARAATATLEGGTVTLREGESASFPIRGGSDGPANLNAECEIADVNGSASITFDGEYYVPLSEPAVGDVITLSRGDTRTYSLSGVVDAKGQEAYVAFRFGGAAAAMCFPGMDCGGAEDKAGSVTVNCRDASS